MSAWPRMALGELIEQDRTYVDQLEDRSYKRLSVKLYGKGVVLDAPSEGALVKMSKHQLAAPGQVVVSEIWAKKGAIGVVPTEGEGALITSHFYLFNIASERLHDGWMRWLLRANYFEPQLAGEARGTTGYASVRPRHFLAASIPLPPLDEQRRIVARLDGAAARVEARRQAAAGLERELAATLRAAFARITADAPRARMGDIAPLVRRPVTIDPDASYTEIGVKSFYRGLFSRRTVKGEMFDWQKLFAVERGDLIFSNLMAWEQAIGLAKEAHAGSVGNHRMLTCHVDRNRATPNFLYYYFTTDEGFSQVVSASPGTMVRNKTLSTKLLPNITVPVPSLDAQQWFDRLQHRARAARAAQAEATTHLGHLLPAMLHEAFG